MKNIFILLILIPIFINIKIPYTDWEWNLNIDWDMDDFINQIKTGVPTFIKDMQKDLNEFISQAGETQNKLINQYKENAINAYNNIKGVTDKSYKSLIEETTKAAKFLSYKICNATNLTSYEECRNNKKEVFSQLINIVHEEFQCSKIITIITEQIIKEDIGGSLKYILFLINAISGNPDAIMRGKAQVLYDTMNCLKEELTKHWPEIEQKLKETNIDAYKQDITNVVIQSMENLVGVIHFEELDGYIPQCDAKTGLINNEYAKMIHKNIFETLKKLNHYGTQFYNFSPNLAVNVTTRQNGKDLDINQQIMSEFPEKGIKILYNADYFFKEFENVNSIQTVVFDSPLVSIRGRSEKEGGTANTFVGITLYDNDGNEVINNDLNIEKLKPIIYYKKNLFKAMTHCLFYNEQEDKIEDTGVETKTIAINGEEYIQCIPNHLTSFTIGSYKSSSTGSNVGTIILVVVLCILIIALAAGGFLFWKKRNRVNSSQFNQAFPNKDGLLS